MKNSIKNKQTLVLGSPLLNYLIAELKRRNFNIEVNTCQVNNWVTIQVRPSVPAQDVQSFVFGYNTVGETIVEMPDTRIYHYTPAVMVENILSSCSRYGEKGIQLMLKFKGKPVMRGAVNRRHYRLEKAMRNDSSYLDDYA